MLRISRRFWVISPRRVGRTPSPGTDRREVGVRAGGDLGSMLARGYLCRRVLKAQLGESLPVKLARGSNLTVCTLSHDDAAMAAIHRPALGGLR